MKRFLLSLVAVMMAFVAPYAQVVTPGTSAYPDYNGEAYTVNGATAVKAGTSKAAGTINVTVPAGTKVISFDAVAWKGSTNAVLQILQGETEVGTCTLVADDGITGNGPAFTITATETAGSVALNPAPEVETTYTFTCAKRFMLYNVAIVDVDAIAEEVYTAYEATMAKFTELTNTLNTYSEAVQEQYIPAAQAIADVLGVIYANFESSYEDKTIVSKAEGLKSDIAAAADDIAALASAAAMAEEESKPAPIDCTDKIVNPSFEQDFTGWTKVQEGSTKMKTSEGNGNKSLTGNNTPFELAQTIEGLEPGVYTLKFQAFGRMKSNEDSWADYLAGTVSSETNVFIYANDAQKEAMNIVYGAVSVKNYANNWTTVKDAEGNELYLLGNSGSASDAFSQGKYEDELTGIIVGEDGKLTIGIKKTSDRGSETHYNYYGGADNFRLYKVAELPLMDRDLTKDMFCNWDSYEANANVVATGVGACDFGTSTGLPYGDGNVSGANYADLTGYEVLTLTVTEGTPRLLLNRQGMTNSGAYIEINNANSEYVIAVKDGVWYINIAKITEAAGYAHLNCIKGANWANTTITEAKLYVENPLEKEEWMATLLNEIEMSTAWLEGYTTTEMNDVDLEDALSAAQAVYDNASSTTAQIEEAAVALYNAMGTWSENAAEYYMSFLEDAIETAESIANPSEELAAALKAAKELDEEADFADIKDAYVDLQTAIDAQPAENPFAVTPAEGTIESLSTISISMKDGSMLVASAQDGANITLYGADHTTVATWDAEALSAITPDFDEEYNPIGLTLTLPEAVTAAGNYTLVIDAGVFYDENYDATAAASFSWTVEAAAEPIAIASANLNAKGGKITFTGDIAFPNEEYDRTWDVVNAATKEVVTTAKAEYDWDDYKVAVLTFATELAAGNYEVHIPAGDIIHNDGTLANNVDTYYAFTVESAPATWTKDAYVVPIDGWTGFYESALGQKVTASASSNGVVLTDAAGNTIELEADAEGKVTSMKANGTAVDINNGGYAYFNLGDSYCMFVYPYYDCYASADEANGYVTLSAYFYDDDNPNGVWGYVDFEWYDGIEKDVEELLKPEADPNWVEIAQTQSPDCGDGAERATVVEGNGYTEYTTTANISVIIKILDVDVAGCDSIKIVFAEPIPSNILASFAAKNSTANFALTEGITEYVIALDDSNCSVADDVLGQITLLTLWNGGKTVKIAGVYKHLADTETAISNVQVAPVKNGKFLQNGKIVIVKNGKTYNTAGQLVK